MSDKFPFHRADVSLSSPQSKLVMRRSARQFDADMLYLAYEAPTQLGDDAPLAYGCLEMVLASMASVGHELSKYRKEIDSKLKAKSCRTLEYDEDAAEVFSVRIHCAPAKMFIQMIIELDKIAPLVETMAYHAMMTIPERNRNMRELKNKLVALGQALHERRETIESSLSDMRKKKYQHKTCAPTDNSDLKAIKIRRRPQREVSE